MKKREMVWSALAALIALILSGGGYWLGHLRGRSMVEAEAARVSAKADFWTCSMHPQIRLPGPGKCPLCGMDLIPVRSGASGPSLGLRQLSLGPRAVKLAEIEMVPVESKFLTAQVRMVGKIDYDETRQSFITAWVPGRLDRLYVDYTGVSVNQGDHLVWLYSPELLTAQEELLQAVKTVQSLGSSSLPLIREQARQTMVSAREKLRLWGLTAGQIDEIQNSGQTSDHLTIYSPVSGIVVHKDVLEGMYVNVGTRIYTIADLSQVWVKLDAYESDLAWIHYGQEVEFETEAYAGETFKGRIAFIDPILNPQTRTVKVRVNVSNPQGRLKPEMFVRAIVRSQIASHGKVIDEALAGKWIGPMHPEIVKDHPGKCDICGMDLVKAEDLGFVSPGSLTNAAPLVIPASAPLITGKRAVVYVALTNQPGLFEGRDVVLGPRAGDAYVVLRGLRAGELVVVQGNFKIDSAMQIQAKPSMMSPEGGGPMPQHHHGGTTDQQSPGDVNDALSSTLPDQPAERAPAVPIVFQNQLTRLFKAYLNIVKALSKDQFQEAVDAVDITKQAVTAVDMSLVSGKTHLTWMTSAGELEKQLQAMRQARDIQGVRESLAPLSEVVHSLIQTFGLESGQSAYWVHCPMALQNRGASWLQASTNVANPYFGARMISCGDIVESLGAALIAPEKATHDSPP